MADTAAGTLRKFDGVPPPSAAFQRAMAARPDDIAQTIAQLYQPVRTEDELVEVFSAAAHLAVRFLPQVDWCSITTQLDGNPLTAAHTDERALVVDEHQYTLDDGPCLHAMRTQERVALSDAEVGERWPELAAATEGTNIRSFLAAPLTASPISLFKPGCEAKPRSSP